MKNRNAVWNGKRPYMMAMVLGTALSALGPTGAMAAQHISDQAVSDISRYCTACWRNAHLPMDRWGDCTQQVFCRLLERVQPDRWQRLLKEETEERREFVRAIDAVRKRTQRERSRTVGLPENVGETRAYSSDSYSQEREEVNRAGESILSPRQNQIMQMSMDGWSVQEMAVALGTSAERVSDEKYKAIRKLRSYFTETPTTN